MILANKIITNGSVFIMEMAAFSGGERLKSDPIAMEKSYFSGYDGSVRFPTGFFFARPETAKSRKLHPPFFPFLLRKTFQ